MKKRKITDEKLFERIKTESAKRSEEKASVFAQRLLAGVLEMRKKLDDSIVLMCVVQSLSGASGVEVNFTEEEEEKK